MTFETDMTSDILIYNILKQSDNQWINKCNLKFIDKSIPAEEDDTIYVANVDLETLNETFNHTEYRALVNLFVKTKNTDYLEGSRFLRTVVKEIKKELRGNIECKQRHITFRNIRYEYGSRYTLKGLHLLIQLNEFEMNNTIDDKETCLKIGDVEVEVK